jgi:hypothetical protein
MNDDRPDKPVWLMRDEATLSTIQGLRRQGVTTANIARALNHHQGTAPPKGDRGHAIQGVSGCARCTRARC